MRLGLGIRSYWLSASGSKILQDRKPFENLMKGCPTCTSLPSTQRSKRLNFLEQHEVMRAKQIQQGWNVIISYKCL